MTSPIVTSAAPLPEPVRIFVPNVAQVAKFFNRIRVYRAPSITGTFVEITDAATRIPILVVAPSYEFVDPAGLSTSLYQVDYFDTLTGAASARSEATPATGDNALEILSVTELKESFLSGLLADPVVAGFPDSMYEFYIRSAVAYVQRVLDTPIRSTVYIDERHDFIRQDYEQWIWIQLLNKPARSIQEVRCVLPTDQTIITYPAEWIQLDQVAGVVRIVPGAGATTVLAVGLATMWAPLFASMYVLPDVFRVDYTAGFAPGQTPADIKHLIGMVAAMGPLAIIGDLLFGVGVAGGSISLDALATQTRTTKEFGGTAFGARLRMYQTMTRSMIKEIRLSIQGVRMVVA